MKIKIDTNHMDKINEAIRAVEGRAVERRINAVDVLRAVVKVEHRLGIPKKYMEGVKFSADLNAQEFPRAYKYSAASTHFVAERFKTGWYLTAVERSDCRRPAEKFRLTLTDAAKEEIIRNYNYFNA